MTTRRSWVLGLVLAAVSAVPAMAVERDLYFAESIFWARQGLYFDALARLDAEIHQHRRVDEPELDSLYPYIDDAEFSVGDFELSYRMHHRASRAISAVLEGDVDQAVRNEAAYRLAHIHFQKGQLREALQALERIEGRIPEALVDDVDFLRANVYLATARPDEAAPILKRLQGRRTLNGFSEYNLAIAHLQSRKTDDALAQLGRAGGIKAADEPARAIRDRANLLRGTLLLESGRYDDAWASLERVRLNGPFSNQALLSTGWAHASATRFQQALTPWSLLAGRNRTDPAVQEAMLALPFAYGQLEVYGKAAMLYGEALDAYGVELEQLNQSIASIRNGSFLKALVREEVRKDRDWVIRLRELPETPETYYLMTLMASHDFQTSLSNYLDLEDLRRRLVLWQRSFDAFEDVIEARRAYYEPLLPELDQQFRELDSRRRLRMEQQTLLSERLQNMLVAPRPELLATADERRLSVRLTHLESQLDAEADTALMTRIERLRGVLVWSVRTRYHERLTDFYQHLEESQQAIDALTKRYQQYVRVRQAATHSFQGYASTITRLRQRVDTSISRVDLLMSRQGHLLEQVAIRELETRAGRLEGYQVRARYALADSYDRATQSQSRVEEGE